MSGKGARTPPPPRTKGEPAGALPTRLDPKQIEPKWQRFWEERKLFLAPAGERIENAYSIVLPPPNVTGVLHLGHSLGGTVQDLLCRWHRMRGDPTLWLPGVDHAGLATQMAVRKDLEKKGVRFSELSREEVFAHVDAWRTEKEAYIRRQLTAHGFSLDWTRYVYTLEPRYSELVRTVFLRLFREGSVYRAERMVNWDPKALTALSDLEVIPTEVHGKLWYIRYPAPGGGPQSGIVVATTRPETMFGDVAVAVHPQDARHRALHQTWVSLPLTDRKIPIVTDPAIDPAFGNGALKVTPSHDRVDHEIAVRHPELPSARETFDPHGHLMGEFVPEAFRGLERGKAREKVVEALRAGGFLVQEAEHVHNVGYSERTGVPIEPRLSLQWFVNLSKMGPRALEAVRSGQVKIFPEHWTKTYYNFMEHLEDWCISRQIAWGHRIPVWYCDACGAYDAFEVEPVACAKCGGTKLHQDPDVLDTWFSSWLWPFATLGWPEETLDLERYFPVSVLVTGSDIVFFWVARMIMGSLQFLDQPPFPHVYLTGILTDRQGRKLSKSLGNSPDPLEFIETWGADAFRFGMTFPNPVDQGGFWDYGKILEGARNFLTKVWNLARLLQTSLPEGTPPPSGPPAPGAARPLMDRWLLSRWSATLTEVDGALGSYDITAASTMIYGFLWHEMADWWAEASKDRLAGKEGEALHRETANVGLFVLDRSLRLLHPITPHVTEELWHALPHQGDALAVARWPTEGEVARDEEAEQLVAGAQELVGGLRVLRAEAFLPADARPRALVRPLTEDASRLLGLPEIRSMLVRLAKVDGPEVLAAGAEAPAGARSIVLPGAELFLVLPEGHAGEQEERHALQKERKTVADLLARTTARLADPTFRSKAPPHVVAELEEKQQELTERLALLDRHLSAAGTPT